MIAGAVIRVLLVPDVRVFRLVAAVVVLLPIGVWLTVRGLGRAAPRPEPLCC